MAVHKFVCAVAAMAAACGARAVPEVSGVKLTQPSSDRLYLDYTLSEPAVVTFDVLTNGVSIGRELLEHFTGDRNKVVAAGARRIQWKGIVKTWPDQVVTNRGMTAVVTAWATNAPPDYMIVDLAKTNVTWYAKEADIPGGSVLRDEYKTTKLAMRRIHAKGRTFRMGRQRQEPHCWFTSEQRMYFVTFTEDFYIGVFELTQGQWAGVRPGDAKSKYAHLGDKFPVDNTGYTTIRGPKFQYHSVTNGHAVPAGGFMGMLRTMANGICFDLPTSAQWEFAARAGTETAYNNGSNVIVDTLAWHASNWANDTSLSANNSHEVGLLEPNAWGLYDCLGNMWEVSLDRYTKAAAYYVDCTDPVGPIDGYSTDVGAESSFRCGGGWNNSAAFSRSAMRIAQAMENGAAYVGFRLWAPCEAR